MKRVISKNEKKTKELGKSLAKHIKKGDIICLYGDLGAGKTTFVKGLAHGLNVKEAQVNSPTFVFMNIYDGKMPVYHFDLYRLENLLEIEQIGYDEFMYGNGVAVVEWADRLKDLLPEECMKIELNHKTEDTREIRMVPKGKRYKDLLSKLK